MDWNETQAHRRARDGVATVGPVTDGMLQVHRPAVVCIQGPALEKLTLG